MAAKQTTRRMLNTKLDPSKEAIVAFRSVKVASSPSPFPKERLAQRTKRIDRDSRRVTGMGSTPTPTHI